MRIKIYQAPNMGAAMAMVRDELGPDAFILATQSLEGGVEVTAARDPDSLPPSTNAGSHAAVDTAEPAEATLEPPDLGWHGLPCALAAQLAGTDIARSLAREFRFADLPCSAGAAPLLLVGPPGAGKTTTAARIATRLKLTGYEPLVVTADGRRAGAAEQLAAFTRLLGLTLIVADSPAQLPKAIARRRDDAPVVIDMPGLNPAEPADQQFLRECRTATGAVIALVLPAGLDPADAEELAEHFHELGATLLVATRLDQSRRLGGILAAASVGLALTDAGTSPSVADGLTPMTPEFLAERLAVKRKPRSVPISPLELLARSSRELPRTTQ